MRKECPYCNIDKLSSVTNEIRDSRDSVVRKCESCGLIFLDSKRGVKANSDKLKRYYNREYLIDNSLVAGKRISLTEHFKIRLKTQRQIVPAITPLVKDYFDILEIGCGCGSLLYLLKDYVNSCTGVELDNTQASFVRHKVGCNVYVPSIKEIPRGKKFNAIFLISVLEHMKDPFKTLAELRSLLKPRGFLYIEIPNCNEALLRYLPPDKAERYKKFFYHKAHLYYFTERFFGRLLKSCGYRYKVSSRHDYTLINFLHWWFLGKRQTQMEKAQCDAGLYESENSLFKKEMNDIFKSADAVFKKVMAKHRLSYILTYIANPTI